MRYTKMIRDWLFKAYLGQGTVPAGLAELQRYFRNYPMIHFDYHTEDGMIVAVSRDFRYGSIVTYGKNEQELDTNIKDAIMTAFSIPSSYKKEVALRREGEAKEAVYAAA